MRELSSYNFDQEIEKGLIIIDFWATWCSPCKVLLPVLEEILNESGGKVDIKKVNADNNIDLCNRFSIKSLPTLLFLKDGQEIDRIIGGTTKTYIKSKIEKYV